MCRVHETVRFYKCTHTQEYHFHSANPDCQQVKSYEKVNFEKRCPFCEGGRGWAEISEEGQSCNGYTGTVTIRYKLPDELTSPQTTIELWEARRSLMKEYDNYRAIGREDNATKQIAKSVTTHRPDDSREDCRKYFIDTCTPNNPLFEILSEEDVLSDEDLCVICQSYIVTDDE